MGMIDREKVIRHITAEIEIARMCKKGFAPVDIDMLSDALALLKEQDAKPPRVRENAYGRKFYYCPKCNRAFDFFNQESYCHDCGQEVKWG